MFVKATSNFKECPVEQPHAKWDQRCVGAGQPGRGSEAGEAQALVTTSGGPGVVSDLVTLMVMVTSAIRGLLTLT